MMLVALTMQVFLAPENILHSDVNMFLKITGREPVIVLFIFNLVFA